VCLQDKKGGIIRYPAPEAASEALAGFNAKSEEERSIAGLKASLKMVEGEEEQEFYKRVRSYGEACFDEGCQLSKEPLAQLCLRFLPCKIRARTPLNCLHFVPYLSGTFLPCMHQRFWLRLQASWAQHSCLVQQAQLRDPNLALP